MFVSVWGQLRDCVFVSSLCMSGRKRSIGKVNAPCVLPLVVEWSECFFQCVKHGREGEMCELNAS